MFLFFNDSCGINIILIFEKRKKNFMKCEKCGGEISTILGICVKCHEKEMKKIAEEEGIIDLIKIDTFSMSKNSKYNLIRFTDSHFSPKFDYKNKPIDTNNIFLPLLFVFGLCSMVSFIYLFQSIFKNGPSPLTISLPFVFAFLAWICFYIPSHFNPSLNLGFWEINKEGFKVIYLDPKSKKTKKEENIEFKINRENIIGIEIRKITDTKNEYILSPTMEQYDQERFKMYENNQQNNAEQMENLEETRKEIMENLEKESKDGYYTFYIRLANSIYIENQPKKEIRLLSYVFPSTVNLENIKAEMEKILEI